MSNPTGLIPRLLKLHEPGNEAKLEEYAKYYQLFQKQLQLLPASHLLVDKGQEDVQAYDIDGRLEVYIEPSGVEKNPANTTTTEFQSQFDLEKSLSKFLKNPELRTYVALGDAGSGKTLFTLWTFKKYVLQPWHNYRNKNLQIYLCSTQPDKLNIKTNAIYLYLKEDQIQYISLVKNYKHESDKKEQIIIIDAMDSWLYQQIKQLLKTITNAEPQKYQFASIYEKEEFFNLLKPKWLPIYIPLKNYAYPGKNKKGQEREKDDKQTPLCYIEDALLTDYNINPQDLLRLKKGLSHEQNILFILDGYDELGKGNNPNFSQALLAGVEDVLICAQKPQEIKEAVIYIYLNNQTVNLLFKKIDNTGKLLIDKDINNQELSKKLRNEILSLQSANHTPILNINLLKELFKYTSQNHQYDLTSHTISWKHAKIFVTGRPEHFDDESQHQSAFALHDANPQYAVNYMAKFTSTKIEAYIAKYKQVDPKCAEKLVELENNNTILHILNSFGNLTELLQNPFLLNITLQALPILLKKYKNSISRATVYEGFIEYWYTKEISRKEQAHIRRGSSQEVTIKQKKDCYQFAQELVIQMFIHNTISIAEKTAELWKFFNKLENTFARETCPLQRSGNEYSFIHKSVYEYLFARYLMTTPWDNIQILNEKENGYNASIARLLKEEPSVFSFIQDFARSYVTSKTAEILTSSINIEKQKYIQTQNLYNIFLELLRWNEHTLALRLITGQKKSAKDYNDDKLNTLFRVLLANETETVAVNITNKLALGTSIYACNPPKIKEKLIVLMQPNYYTKIEKQPTLFLNLVGWGEQELAEKILQTNPTLACFSGNLTDCSGRTWKQITALQYAVLVLDYHMWKMILKYINPEEIHEQLKKLASNATLNEEGWDIKATLPYVWPSVGWNSLIKALNAYIEHYDYNIWPQVGAAQLILPAHVINEYSHSSRPFYPCPEWGDSEAYLPRTGVSDWLTANNGKYHLGKEFAWCRAYWDARARNGGGVLARYDHAAVTKLLRTRIEQARDLLLKSKLLIKMNSKIFITI